MMSSVLSIILIWAAVVSTNAFVITSTQQQRGSRITNIRLLSSPANDVSDVEETATDLGDGCIPTEPGGPKAKLLEAIENARGDDIWNDNKATTVFGGFTFGSLFSGLTSSSSDDEDDDGASSSAASKIPDLAKSLENTYVLPLQKPSGWSLIYTNAPDLLGVEGGPLSQLVSIEHKILSSDDSEKNELSFVLNYKPSDGIQSILGGFVGGDDGIQDDTLSQTVTFEYDVDVNHLSLKLQSTEIESSRFGNAPSFPLPSFVPSIEALKVVYNDGDIRMDRTVQGDFLFIYQRTDKDQCEIDYDSL